MYEKVNPLHPDKVADRIAGAFVDLAYTKQENPKVAVEVLIGHNDCTIIAESSVEFTTDEALDIVRRIAGKGINVHLTSVPQDTHLANNQSVEVHCGDNGIFKGVPLIDEERELSHLAREIYEKWEYDGKYIIDKKSKRLVVCQSNAKNDELKAFLEERGYHNAIINPIGEWTGGINVDSGATNRKLGSDMAQSVTGGGLHGKDLSKADVSLNIYAFVKAQETGRPVELCCAIGDGTVDGKPYNEIVDYARDFIRGLGGFEAFAEWGLF